MVEPLVLREGLVVLLLGKPELRLVLLVLV